MIDTEKLRRVSTYLHWWGSALLMASLPWSRFLTTVSLFILPISTLVVHFAVNRKDIRSLFGTWARGIITTPWWTMLCFFIPDLISGLWSENTAGWLEQVKLRLPYLVLPLVFIPIQPFTREARDKLLYVLYLSSVAAVLFVLGRYAIRYDEYSEAISKGQTIKTPIGHIRFSLVVVMGLVSGIPVLINRSIPQSPLVRGLHGAGLIFLFVGIHVLAIRSGWVALYQSLLILTLYAVYKTKRTALIPLTAAALLCSFWLSYMYVPSVRTKIGYMRWDYSKHLEGAGAYYSDSDRWVSQEVGKSIAAQHFWLGTGAGDLQHAVKQYYARVHPERIKVLTPHNMYIYALASTGIMGLVMLIVGLAAPFYYSYVCQEPLSWIVTAVVASSMLVEPYMGNSTATALHAFFISLCFIRVQSDLL